MTTIPDSDVIVQQPYTSAVMRTQHDKNQQFLELKDFAVMNGTTDDTQNFLNWITALKTSGKPGWFNEGVCNCNSAILIDLAAQNGNLTIFGAGMGRSRLRLSNVTTAPAFKIYDSNGSTNADLFYCTFRDWGIETNINGTGVMLGSHDFSDALNGCEFSQFGCWNSSTGASAVALEINYVVQSHFNVTCNTGSSGQGGAAIRMRQMGFCTLRGSGGNSAISLHFTDGYNFANTIIAFDSEEVQKCVVIDNAQTAQNTFISNQLVWKSGGYGIDAPYGYNNLFINPNFGLSTGQVNRSEGITIIGNPNTYGTHYLPSIHARIYGSNNVLHQLTPGTGMQAIQQFNNKDAVCRWQLRQDNSPESGSNTGSNLVFSAYSDTGTFLGDPLYFSRANQITTIQRASLQGVGFLALVLQHQSQISLGHVQEMLHYNLY